MKTINYKLLLVMLISVISLNWAKAQCSATFTYADNGNGVITLQSTSDSIYYVSWQLDSVYIGNGDVNTITLPNGTYEICMFIEDSATSCYNSTCQNITVNGTGLPCNASISYVDNGNGSISFINNSTSGSGAAYGWIFGDSNSSSLENPTHIYANPGTYFVEFAVMDTNCVDSAFLSITVNINTSCSVVPMFSSVDNGNGSFTFTDASTTSSGAMLFGTWFFGDGATGYTDNFNNSTSHTYAADGIYVVVLEAYDSLDNCSNYYTQTIVVSGVNSPVACNAAFVMFPDSSSTTNFIIVNSSTGSNLSYFWDFGDGNTSTQAYPNYTYSTAGPFELCLTVTGDSSCTSTYCDSISDGGVISKQAGFTINVVSPSSTLSVNDNKETVTKLNIYPNPAKELLNIEMDLVKNTAVELFVTDITGKVVAQIANNQNQVGKQKYQWNVGSLQNGVYLLNIKSDNNIQVKKVMINR